MCIYKAHYILAHNTSTMRCETKIPWSRTNLFLPIHNFMPFLVFLHFVSQVNQIGLPLYCNWLENYCRCGLFHINYHNSWMHCSGNVSELNVSDGGIWPIDGDTVTWCHTYHFAAILTQIRFSFTDQFHSLCLWKYQS